MKASHFPRVCRGWNPDTNEMLYPDKLIERGFTVSPDGLPAFRERPFPVVLMWFSGQLDSDKKPIFEGDILKIHVPNEFGSIVIDYGVMRWNGATSQFYIAVPAQGVSRPLNLGRVELLGNEFENPELVPLVKNEDNQVPANG